MDPNKYAKNAGIQPDTPLKNIMSVGSILLVVLGIVGIATEFFKESGWAGATLGYFSQSTNHLLLIPLIIGALWLLNRWVSSPSQTTTKKSGNFPMYIMMLVGAYYLFRLITTAGF